MTSGPRLRFEVTPRRFVMMPRLRPLPCLDSPAMAASRRQELDIPRDVAAALGRSAVEAASQGYFVSCAHRRVEWRDAVRMARAGQDSIAPHAALPRQEESCSVQRDRSGLSAKKRTWQDRNTQLSGESG